LPFAISPTTASIPFLIAKLLMPEANWLLILQNNDGGIPTFLPRVGHAPLRPQRHGPDSPYPPRLLRPCPDYDNPPRLFPRLFGYDTQRGFTYLSREQRPDGSWLPLWFGNQHAPDDINPTYGTARVLAAYRDLDKMNDDPLAAVVAFLLSIQNADGGWGGAANTPSSIEETALAVEILLDAGPDARKRGE